HYSDEYLLSVRLLVIEGFHPRTLSGIQFITFPGMNNEAAFGADQFQIAYQRVRLAHPGESYLRGQSRPEPQLHLRGILHRRAKIRIGGLTGYVRDVLASEPAQAVHQMNAGGKHGTSAGKLFVQVPWRGLQEAKVFQDAVPAQNDLT